MMDELTRYRTAVAEARAALEHVSAEVRNADVVTDELRQRADGAIQAHRQARADLERAEAIEAEIAEARAANPLAAAAGQVTNPTAEGEATRAIASALRAAMRGGEPDHSTREVFARYGADDTRDANGALVIPAGLAKAAEDERANAASTAGALTSQVNYSRGRVYGIMRPVDPMAVLGIAMQDVGTGEAEYLWTTAAPAGTAYAEDATLAQLDVQPTTGVEQRLSPTRIAAPGGWTVEAAATLGDMADLVRNEVLGAMRTALVGQAFTGDGTGANLSGLNSRAEPLRARPAAVDTFATVVTAVESQVDGTYATTIGDLSMLVTPTAHAFLASLRVSDDSTESAASYLMRVLMDYGVSAYAPADYDQAGGGKVGHGHKLLVRRGRHEGAYALPHWGMRIQGDDGVLSMGVGQRVVAWQLARAFWPQAAAAEGLRADFGTVDTRSVADN